MFIAATLDDYLAAWLAEWLVGWLLDWPILERRNYFFIQLLFSFSFFLTFLIATKWRRTNEYKWKRNWLKCIPLGKCNNDCVLKTKKFVVWHSFFILTDALLKTNFECWKTVLKIKFNFVINLMKRKTKQIEIEINEIIY